MTSRTALLLLLGVLCASFAHFATGEIVLDCCLTVSDKHFPLQRIQSYQILEAGKGCVISATAFFTKGGRRICVSHPKDKEWVRNHIKYLDEMRPQ